ncbi:MAG: hypothetical protein R6V25_01940 [Desulfatiglandales bacterium]
MEVLEKDQARVIRAWGENLAGHVEVTLVRTGDERTAYLERFCERLGESAPAVGVSKVTGEEGDLPAILIGDSWTIHMAPEGKELAPFLDLLSRVAAGEGREWIAVELSGSVGV